MAAKLNNWLTREAVLAKVPAFSPGILRVIDLLAKDDASAVVLAQAISTDPSLSAQVLKLANSALFGSQSRVDTVQKAVVSVGHTWIQHLAVTLGVRGYMRTASQTPELQRCWRHMLATAVLSREMARAAGISPERTYTIGLLHDIGRLGLLAAFPAEYSAVLQDTGRERAPLLDRERATFGMDHCELGRSLLEAWNFPADFAAIAAGHHDPGTLEFGAESVVRTCCRLADALGFFFVPPFVPIALEEARALMPPFARTRFPSEEARLVQIVEEALTDNDLGCAEHYAPLPPPALPAEPRAAPRAEAATPPQSVEVHLFAEATPASGAARWIRIALAAAFLIAVVVTFRHW